MAWDRPLLIDSKKRVICHAIRISTPQACARRRSKLIKYRENSRWYHQYGPYALTDPETSNCLVAWGMDLETVERELRRSQD